jgi:hypothetical protein
MRNWLGTATAAAAALVAGAATATPIVVGESRILVIDVEFWGRQELRFPNPDDPTDDIVKYGAPFDGSFRISAADVPKKTHRTSAFPDDPNAVRYAGAPGAEFVTTDRIFGESGLASDDSVVIGDSLPFYANRPPMDWFQVSDAFTDTFPYTTERRELFVSVTTPLDIIQGTGLNQEFDLVAPRENGGTGGGFFWTKVDGAVQFVEFIVDRLRVSSSLVCRP